MLYKYACYIVNPAVVCFLLCPTQGLLNPKKGILEVEYE